MQNSLQNEIKIMQQLNNPHIVQYKDHIQTKKECFIFTEYCEGGSLRHYIERKGGTLNEEEAVLVLN